MKLWMASDNSLGAWYDVDKVDPMHHGRAEHGEILNYYEDDKKTPVASYYWDSQYSKYRKRTF